MFRINTSSVVHKVHGHGILCFDGIMLCNGSSYFTVCFNSFHFKNITGCLNKRGIELLIIGISLGIIRFLLPIAIAVWNSISFWV